MSRLTDLYAQRATAWEQVKSIRGQLEAAGDAATEEQDTAFRDAMADVDKLSARITDEERAARLDEVDYGQVRSSGSDDVDKDGDGTDNKDRDTAYRAAFRSWAQYGMDELSTEQRQLLRRGAASPQEMKELRAQGVATGGAGGFTVPEEFMTKMTETLKAFGGVLSVANILNTSNGNPIPWAANDDTNNEGALLAENTQVGEQDFTFDPRQLGAHMYTSKMVRASLQLIQDSAFDMDSWLPRRLGERLGRAMSRHLAVGTGSNQPVGIVGVPIGTTGAAGQTSTIVYDDLIELEYSVDRAYREQGNARWAGNDQTFKALRKLKDADGRPLWQPSLVEGRADLLNGYPLLVDNSLPSPAAGAKSLLFGDFNAAFVVRLVRGTTVLRLTERFADFLQVGFLAFQRMDSVIDDPSAAKAYRHPVA